LCSALLSTAAGTRDKFELRPQWDCSNTHSNNYNYSDRGKPITECSKWEVAVLNTEWNTTEATWKESLESITSIPIRQQPSELPPGDTEVETIRRIPILFLAVLIFKSYKTGPSIYF
jgi:hypothetical protein